MSKLSARLAKATTFSDFAMLEMAKAIGNALRRSIPVSVAFLPSQNKDLLSLIDYIEPNHGREYWANMCPTTVTRLLSLVVGNLHFPIIRPSVVCDTQRAFYDTAEQVIFLQSIKLGSAWASFLKQRSSVLKERRKLDPEASEPFTEAAGNAAFAACELSDRLSAAEKKLVGLLLEIVPTLQADILGVATAAAAEKRMSENRNEGIHWPQ
jgi:hypothetical protein